MSDLHDTRVKLEVPQRLPLYSGVEAPSYENESVATGDSCPNLCLDPYELALACEHPQPCLRFTIFIQWLRTWMRILQEDRLARHKHDHLG